MTTLRWTVAGAATVGLLAACEYRDPVSTAGGSQGQALIVTANPSAATLPTAATLPRLVFSLDPGVRDAFSRRPTNATTARRTRFFLPPPAAYWEWPRDVTRNASAARLDPRFPFVQSTTSSLNDAYPFIDLYQPASDYPGDEYWEMFTILSGLTPSTSHQFAFVHHRLKVAGQLDHAERILTGTVTQPDTLIRTGGAPASIYTNWTGSAPVGCAPFPGVNSNPFIIATFNSSAGGNATLDKCWQSGNGIWTAAEFDQQAKSMVGRSDDQPYSLPNYNYIEVWEGAYGTGRLVMRVQIAQDLDLQGNPIANAFPPFPAPNTNTSINGAPPAADRATSFPLPLTTLVGLAGTVGVPTGVKVTARNLQRLGGNSVYKAWWIDPSDASDFAPATGNYRRVVGTDTVEQADGVSSFKGGPGTVIFDANNYLQDIGTKTYADSLTFLVITVESDANAAQPSLAQALWMKVSKQSGAATTLSATFGSFNVLPSASDSAGPMRFVPQGRMSGGVIGDTTLIFFDTTADGQAVRRRASAFVGSVIDLRFTGLQRPPVGYEYRGYLVPKDAEAEPVDIGTLIGPNGESLADADVDPRTSNLTRDMIMVSRLVFDVATGPPTGDTLCDYARVQLVLQPKTAEAPPASIIFDAALPGRLTSARECR